MTNLTFTSKIRKWDIFSLIFKQYEVAFFEKNRFVADFNDPTILNNDIGLVRLENDISFTKFINPLCLPPMGETGFGNSAYGDGNSSTLDTAGLNIVGKNATVIGWGAVNDGEHIVWKLLKMSHLNFWSLAFSTNFCPIKIDLSGNTVWPQASGFQKLAKMDHFEHF